ncbi:MAG: hypothetical protein KIH00_14030, partial [Lachnospiraceae bacterium]|nr:hypothetical protein [Lachnospiraceae bacterium]
WSIGQIKTCRKKQHVKIDDIKEMSDLICGKAAVGGNYNSTRDSPCRKTNCIYHGNCTACIEKHRSKNKPTRCERLKAKLTKKGRGGVVMDSEDYEREKAEKKLLIKLQEAEEVV